MIVDIREVRAVGVMHDATGPKLSFVTAFPGQTDELLLLNIDERQAATLRALLGAPVAQSQPPATVTLRSVTGDTREAPLTPAGSPAAPSA